MPHDLDEGILECYADYGGVVGRLMMREAFVVHSLARRIEEA
jgi:hypothetical protein